MSDHPDFDLQAAHRYFAPRCFNRAWEYIDRATRSREEEEAMLQLAMASLWHWGQREDLVPRNIAIGAWQVSRVHALAGRGQEALRYGQMSLDAAAAEMPFYRAIAHEAMARASMVSGHALPMREHVEAAQRLLEEVTDPEEREILEKDLKTIG